MCFWIVCIEYIILATSTFHALCFRGGKIVLKESLGANSERFFIIYGVTIKWIMFISVRGERGQGGLQPPKAGQKSVSLG